MNFYKITLILFLYILCAAGAEEKVKKEQIFEFSFGTSQMYIKDTERQELSNKEKITLPTNSALLIGEYIFFKRLGGTLIFNLPLSSQKFIVDNRIEEERASPYLGLGPRWSPLHINIFDRAFFEPQLAAFMGTLFLEDWKLKAVPVLAGRLHLSTKDGFTMYLGSFYIVGIEAMTVFYGVGHRF
jgi:hypothetical protein